MGSGYAFGGSFAPGWIAAGAALVLAAGLWQYVALRRRVPRGKALLLAWLRCLSLGAILVLLAGPRLLLRSLRESRRPLAVAVDASLSMGLRGGLETTRLERVQAFVGSREFARALQGFTPSFFSFAGAVAPLEPAQVGTLRADGTASAVEAAASAAAEGAAAVVVFTDGGHASARTAREAVAASGVPVVFVGVGGGERTRDAEIAGVEPPAVAFASSPAALRVTLKATGFEGTEVPLLLKRGEQVLASRTVRLPADGAAAEAVLEWTPPAPGKHQLTVQVPLQDGEQIADNNRVDLSVEAVRDRIRVLLVSGTPGWSYRFLRSALKGDPGVDVVSFIILRSVSDAVDVPQQELSLIPFPTQKIFLEELSNFDLLVFDNFSYQPYLPSLYLEKVEEFVRGGGGFWMLGGPQSFLGGRYQGGPLAPLLPVTLPADPQAAAAGFRDVPVQPRLTAAGRAHPFFQGVAQLPEPPPLAGYNVSGPARAGAVVLAEAALPEGGAQPLVVLGRHGRGRVLAVLTDSLWRWSFEEAGRGRGNRAFLAFVRQALRWSIGDPQLEPVQVEAERARLAPGETIRARVRVLGEDFLPAASPDLSVTLRGPGGESRALAPTLESPGVYVVEAPAPGEGAWEIVAQASARGAAYGRASASVGVAWPLEEYRSPGLNREALAALLGGRRGALLELGDPGETGEALATALRGLAAPAAVEGEEARPFAEMLPVFLALLGLLAAEWVVRRRSGLD